VAERNNCGPEQTHQHGLCALIGVAPPDGRRTDDAHNDYVFERRVFQDDRSYRRSGVEAAVVAAPSPD
jgi:D-Tyr-tRNAtyr deacylase